MGLCSIWCGGKTFYSLPCKTKDKETGGEDKETGGRGESICSGEYVVSRQQPSKSKVVGLIKCLIHYAVRWHGDLFILSK